MLPPVSGILKLIIFMQLFGDCSFESFVLVKQDMVGTILKIILFLVSNFLILSHFLVLQKIELKE